LPRTLGYRDVLIAHPLRLQQERTRGSHIGTGVDFRLCNLTREMDDHIDRRETRQTILRPWPVSCAEEKGLHEADRSLTEPLLLQFDGVRITGVALCLRLRAWSR